uniref:Acid phosphatase n=1 Tax=Panagrolaimus sp. ES5 TaxID=591445 RepID=A0AC34F4P4_9BILA
MKFLLPLGFILGYLISIGLAADDLIFVQAIWRHGDRSPTETFTKDRNQEDAWVQGWGQLTERGMRQHLDLGKKLRSIYVDQYKFLSPDYHNHEIYFLLPFGFILGYLISMGLAADDLIFVQAIWRHGDRSPTETFTKDRNQEDAWVQGWGQLTEWGMRQHLDLGKKLRSIYVDQYKFLSSDYRNHEIYVRSTDVNRTMISAMSNMFAMYPAAATDAGQTYPNSTAWPTYQVDGKHVNRTMISAMSNMFAMYPAAATCAGQTYPNSTAWPTYKVDGKQVGYVPIPIHTINDIYDYTLNADMTCPRQDALREIIKQTPEYIQLTAQKKELLDNLTRITGDQIDLSNIWVVADALFIEKTWNKTWNAAFTDDLYKEINITNDITEYWDNGLQLNKFQDIDFSIEIPKLRGGSLLWSIIGHINQKIDCIANPSKDYCGFFQKLKYYVYSAVSGSLLWSIIGHINQKIDCIANPGKDYCGFFQKLKYYVYSAHDTTLAALFSTLKLNKTNWNEDGYPHYSSAVTVELWRKANTTDNYYIKFVYFPLDPVDNIGHLQENLTIPDCPDPCTPDTFMQRSNPYKPIPSAQELLIANRLSDQPIVSSITGSFWKYNYNAALFNKDGQIGMVVRVQNLKNDIGPSHLAVSTITIINGTVTATPTTNQTFTLMQPAEACGTEDPRITYNDGIYYLFYTAYDCHAALLSSAMSTNPFNFNSWKRFANIDLPLRSWSKSGAALFASDSNELSQDYLFWGDSAFPVGGIGIALGQPGKWSWADTGDYLLKVR